MRRHAGDPGRANRGMLRPVQPRKTPDVVPELVIGRHLRTSRHAPPSAMLGLRHSGAFKNKYRIPVSSATFA